jgi:predicted kinase
MERLDLWWALAGPSKFVAGITKFIVERRRVICLKAPHPLPPGLCHAVERALREGLSLDCFSLDLEAVDQSRALPHVLGDLLGIPAVEVGSVSDFAAHPKLADAVVLITGVDKRELRRWGLFLRHLVLEDPSQMIVGPIIVLLTPTGLTHDELAELCGTARTVVYQGVVDRYDTAGYAAGIGARAGGELAARVGHATVLEVAAWSRELLEHMVTWEVADQIDPMARLQKAASATPLPFPHWENGLVDLWDDEPAAHAVAAIKFGHREHVRRRIWVAQASLMLPFTHRILRSLVQRYRDVLDGVISPSRPFVKRYNNRSITITDPARLEFYDFQEHAKDHLSAAELDLIKIAAWCRNAVAHRDIIPTSTIERFSELYNDCIELLQCEIPGWDWPRCGQTLIMTIGPSSGGKTTWSASQGVETISSDAGDQSGTFRHVQASSAQILSKGRDVIVDAMHVEPEHRKRQAATAPPDIKVRYVIIDRPLEEKRRDGGWRIEKELVDKYDRLFSVQVAAALAGDGGSNVEVVDLRGSLTQI